jgi:hypothetical protein
VKEKKDSEIEEKKQKILALEAEKAEIASSVEQVCIWIRFWLWVWFRLDDGRLELVIVFDIFDFDFFFFFFFFFKLIFLKKK